MTRSEFIELLTMEWDEAVPNLLKMSGMNLPRLCRHLAVDAFINNRHGEVVEELRGQLNYMEKNGKFDLG